MPEKHWKRWASYYACMTPNKTTKTLLGCLILQAAAGNTAPEEMDDQAAAWKSIAMNAIGEEPLGGGDDGLMLPGGDWLAASINSREIPDFTADDFIEPLGELVEHSTHSHSLDTERQANLMQQQEQRPVMRQSFSMNDINSLHLQPGLYQPMALSNPFVSRPALPSVPEEPSRPSATNGFNGMSSTTMVPSFDLMGQGGMFGYGSGFMPGGQFGFGGQGMGQLHGMMPMYAPMPHVELGMNRKNEAGGDTNSSVGPSGTNAMPSLKRGLTGSGQGMRRTQSALELGAWEKMAAGDMEYVDPSGSVREQLQEIEAQHIGKLSPAERLQKILRYRAKRQMRNFGRTIKYQCRKSLADTRPRVRGRFARDNEPGSVLPHETKKAVAATEGPAVKAEPMLATGPESQNELMAMFDQWSEAGTVRTVGQQAVMPGNNASNSA